MDELLSRVVADLQKRYSPQIIILYGSRARGDRTSSSDIDIACFVEGATAVKDARDFEGFFLDAWVYNSNAMLASDDEFGSLLRYVINISNRRSYIEGGCESFQSL